MPLGHEQQLVMFPQVPEDLHHDPAVDVVITSNLLHEVGLAHGATQVGQFSGSRSEFALESSRRMSPWSSTPMCRGVIIHYSASPSVGLLSGICSEQE